MNAVNERIKELSLSARIIPNKIYIAVSATKIKELERKLANMAVKDPVNPLDLRQLFQKAQKIFREQKGTFSKKELRNLISIYPYTYKNLAFSRFILYHIDFSKRTILKKAFMIYLFNYTNNESIELLRIILMENLEKDKTKAGLVPCLLQAPYILEKNGHKIISSHFNNGIEIYLRRIMFPLSAFYSQYIYVAIFSFFSDMHGSAESKLKVAQEIYKSDNYKFLIPKIAEGLILIVHHKGTNEDKDKTVQILHAQMGDPRYSSGREYKWNFVSETVRNIYLSWLKRSDLQLFFDVISRTAKDGMWSYRRTFWERYLDKMYYTRVVLDPYAANIARSFAKGKQLDYAKLHSHVHNQSLFMFSIGNYTFVEASHDGKLRIWRNGDCPIPFYENSTIRHTYSYEDVRNSPKCIEEFIHSSPKTNSWQSKVDLWIRRNIPNI